MKKLSVSMLPSALLLLATQAFAQSFTYVPIDVHCDAAAAPKSCPAGLVPGQVASQTSARGISPSGHIVGFYVDGAGLQHGFLMQNAQYTSLDFPVAGVRATSANGINPEGDIVGSYTLPVNDPNHPLAENSPLYCPSGPDPACSKSFFYRNGKFSTVMFPATVDANGQEHIHPGATVQRITPNGDIYGCFHDHDLGMSMFSAIWSRFDTASLADNGGELSDPMPVPMSMNTGATPGYNPTIVGFFVDMSTNQQHGYVVRNGNLQPYDPTPDTTLAVIWDINRSQAFVGAYRKAGEVTAKRHGFLQYPASDGSVTAPITFDVSFTTSANTVTAFSTTAFGINADGIIVGQYTLVSGGDVHGFAAIQF